EKLRSSYTSVTDSTLPSGSLNHATLAPLGESQIPSSSCFMNLKGEQRDHSRDTAWLEWNESPRLQRTGLSPAFHGPFPGLSRAFHGPFTGLKRVCTPPKQRGIRPRSPPRSPAPARRR